MKVKNVIIINDYDYVQGGASLVAIETANLLHNDGYNVKFLCSVSDRKKSILENGIDVIACNKYDSINNPNKIKGMIQGITNKNAKKIIEQLLSKFNIDETVVLIHGYTKGFSTSFISVCKKYNVKTVLTAHDYFSICPNGGLFNYKKSRTCKLQKTFKCKFVNCDSRSYLYKIYRNVRFFYQEYVSKFRKRINVLITISKTNEELLYKYFPYSKIVRLYNPTSINNNENRIECEKNSNYIYVGRVDKEKGIEYLCKTILSIKEKLTIVGDGNVYEELKRKYSSNDIQFKGWLSHNEVINEMKKSKALIFPSLLYEGAPLTIFEAKSIGLPCFVSKYSNASDFVNDSNGFIYDPFDDSLSKYLSQISEETIRTKSIESYKSYWENPFDKSRYLLGLKKIIDGDEF